MTRGNRRNGAVIALVCALFASSAWLVGDSGDQFSDWPAPVNLGPLVNTPANDAGSTISPDGLSLYFVSNRPGTLGGGDIWVSQRAHVDDLWGPPQNLGPTVNSLSFEQTPTISSDGHMLFFTSNRPGGFGGFDLYVSRRHNKRDDFAWQAPVNLGSEVNSSAQEFGPALFEDDATGTISLYFSSNRPGLGGFDIYATQLGSDETFGPPVLVEELSGPFNDVRPAIRRDGLELLMDSDRPGTFGLLDLWSSTRAHTTDPWSAPVNLGSVVNGPADDFRPALSSQGTTLYYSSNRPGGAGDLDIYMSVRFKLE